jgi:hypothetical protein
VPLKRRGPLVERISFGIVRVYWDDIQEIFSILKEVSDDVRIQADDFVATEPQDLLDISSGTINATLTSGCSVGPRSPEAQRAARLSWRAC